MILQRAELHTDINNLKYIKLHNSHESAKFSKENVFKM